MKLIIYVCGLVLIGSFSTVRCADNASNTISEKLIQEVQRRIQEQEKQQKQLLAQQMAALITSDESGKRRGSISTDEAKEVEQYLADNPEKLQECLNALLADHGKKISHVRSSSI